MAGYYEKDKDYSAAIEYAKSLGQDTTQLERERQNKINDPNGKYNGVEPTMWGSDKTYSQLTGSNANWQNQGVVRNAVNTANTAKNNAIMDAARQAALGGNWDEASSIANGLATPDGYYGGVNLQQVNGFLKSLQDELGYNATDYYNRLYDQVYGNGAAELFDLTGGAIQFGGGDSSGAGANAASLLALLNGVYSPQSNNAVDRLAAELYSMNFDDWMQGDQYKNLESWYRKQGQDTMQDVIGEVSARTGGLASSYATSAAAQQYNDVMSALNQVAMEMFDAERGYKMDELQIARALEQDQYNREIDNRNYLYQLGQDEKAALADKAAMLASAGDFSGYKALGYSDAEIAMLQAAYKAEQAAKNAPEKPDDAPKKSPDYDNVRNKAMSYDDIAEAEAYLQRMVSGGYITEEEYRGILAVDLGGVSSRNLNESHFKASMQSIAQQLSQGMTEDAEDNVNRIWNELSDDQRAQVRELLDRYGQDVVPD